MRNKNPASPGTPSTKIPRATSKFEGTLTLSAEKKQTRYRVFCFDKRITAHALAPPFATLGVTRPTRLNKRSRLRAEFTCCSSDQSGLRQHTSISMFGEKFPS